MARKSRKASPKTEQRRKWVVYALPMVFLIVEIIKLPGAASPYRIPKLAIAIAGLALIVGFGLASRLRSGAFSMPGGGLAATLLVLPALQFASAFWSASPQRAITSGVVTLVWVSGALWIATLDFRDRQRLLYWSLAGASFSALFMALQAAGVDFATLEGFSGTDRTRLTGLAGNPSDMAMAAVLILPLLVVSLEFTRKHLLRWIVVVILVGAVLLSLTLTGYAALLALILVWGFQHGSTKVRVAGALIVGTLVSTMVIVDPGNRLRLETHRLKKGRYHVLMSARGDGWSAALQMIRNHPILGVGAAHYSHSYYPNRLQWLEENDEIGSRGEMATHFSWAHCDPLQLTAELGVGGAIWLVVFSVVVWRTRSRGDPVPLLAAAVFAPFALLHYPTHLAVGMVPLVLILGHLLANQRSIEIPLLPLLPRALIMITIIGCAMIVATFQVRNTLLDAWRGGMEAMLVAANSAEGEERSRDSSIIEVQAAAQLQHNRHAADWILRVVGRARLLRENTIGAETAFRRAFALMPHEEAEFGLGLALSAQGRREEAIIHLGRVCRLNPALAKLIPDPDLRRSVRVLGNQRRARSR